MTTMKCDVTAAINRDLSELCKMQHNELLRCREALELCADWITGHNQSSAEQVFRAIKSAITNPPSA